MGGEEIRAGICSRKTEQRGGVDEVEMTADDFREGVLGPMAGVAGEQFQIGVAHVQKDNVAGRGNPPRIRTTAPAGLALITQIPLATQHFANGCHALTDHTMRALQSVNQLGAEHKSCYLSDRTGVFGMNHCMDDHELLCRYAKETSEDAFRRLVERHGGLVYGVAMRQLRRPHQAEEVTHAVFVALARKAATLKTGTILAGWLFRATRFAAAKFQRDEERRQRREEEAAAMMDTGSTSDSMRDWEQIVPMLDDELAGLSEKERGAVMLRFFQDRSFKEIGELLGTSEDAAKMRVSRALDKLRRRFLKRGVALSATSLAAVFSSQAFAATMVMPSELAVSVTKAVVAKGAPVALVQAILRILTWWKWKPVVVSVGVILIAGSIGLLLSRYQNSGPAAPATTPAWPPRR